MRHVNLAELVARSLSDQSGKRLATRLARAAKAAGKKAPKERLRYIRRNGARKWSPIKDRFTTDLGNKCWYTEVELVGAPLTVDHYRPIVNYPWLAFEVENYRIACPWANSPEHNALHGSAGGKGDNFPLLSRRGRASRKETLKYERPALLDPCNASDCALLAFQADGRPVLHPDHATEATAQERVRQSTLLLNLDHPEFNAKREQLCRDIAADVHMYEALPTGSPQRAALRDRLTARISPQAPFSTAATFYLRTHRHLDWVENILLHP